MPYLLLFLILFISGCKQKEAYNFNQKIIKLEQSLVPEIEKTESEIEGYFKDEDYESLAEAAERMEKKVDKKLRELKDTDTPELEEAENFKKASVKYFTFIKSIYTQYKRMGQQETSEELEVEKQKLIALARKREAAIEAMQKAQNKFAKANGLKIDKEGQKEKSKKKKEDVEEDDPVEQDV